MIKSFFYLAGAVCSVLLIFSCQENSISSEEELNLKDDSKLEIISEEIARLTRIEKDYLVFKSFDDLDEFQRIIANANVFDQLDVYSELGVDIVRFYMLTEYLDNVDVRFDPVARQTKKLKYWNVREDGLFEEKRTNEFSYVANNDGVFRVGEKIYKYDPEGIKLYAARNSSAYSDLDKGDKVLDLQYEVDVVKDEESVLRSGGTCWSGSRSFNIGRVPRYRYIIDCCNTGLPCSSGCYYRAIGCPGNRGCRKRIADGFTNVTQAFSGSTSYSNWFERDSNCDWEDNSAHFCGEAYAGRISHSTSSNYSGGNTRISGTVRYTWGGSSYSMGINGSSYASNSMSHHTGFRVNQSRKKIGCGSTSITVTAANGQSGRL